MRSLCALAFCVAALSLASASRADEPQKSDKSGSPGAEKKIDPALLLGKWVRTDKYVGTTFVFLKNGTYTTTSVHKAGQPPVTMTGNWKLKGDQLYQVMQVTTKTTVTITKLTDTAFEFKNGAGQEAIYERVAEKKK